jgi:hypothetical protein
MALDIIYPIILTPIAFAVGYGIHAFRKSMKQELPEAKPYEFERDEYKPDFDQFSQAIYSITNFIKEKQNDNNQYYLD